MNRQHEIDTASRLCKLCTATKEMIQDGYSCGLVECSECTLSRMCVGTPPRCDECRDAHFSKIAAAHIAGMHEEGRERYELMAANILNGIFDSTANNGSGFVYNNLPCRADLHQVSLAECALRMRPSHSYKLYVHPIQVPHAMCLIKTLGAFTIDNPFAPYINLIPMDTLKRDEWFIEGDAGDAWGSDGL